MPIATVRSTTVAVKKEATFMTNPTVSSANVIRVRDDFSFDPAYDNIEVNEIRNTKDKLPTLPGKLTVSGSIAINLRGSGTAGTAPEGDPLFECAIGTKNTSISAIVGTGSTTTSIVLTSGGGAGFSVGDAIRVGLPTPEVTWVIAKNGDTLTVSPALSSAPDAGVVIGAGVHYKTSLAELPSFWKVVWAGDITRFDFGGNKVDSVTFDISVGAVCSAKFDYKGVKMVGPVAESYLLGTPIFNSLDPFVGVKQILKIGGSLVRVDKISFTIKNEIFDREDITSDGISDRIHTGREITGSFSVLYENADVFNAFKNRTDNEAYIVLSTDGALASGKIIAIRIPKMRYTNVKIDKNNNLYQNDVTFMANITNGEDAITSVSFL